MPRYKPRPKGYFDEDDFYFDPPRNLTVHVDDHRPTNTGLCDVRGNPLYRFPARRPAGFIEPQED